MKFGKALRQVFKQVTNHPDLALINAIYDNDLNGVKKAFARGADVNSEYNAFVVTDTFIYTPIDFAISNGASPAITREILSHKPDLSKVKYGETLGARILTLPDGRDGKRLANAFDNFMAIMESGLAAPQSYHLTHTLYVGSKDGRTDIVEFFATHSDETRKTLKDEGARYADSLEATRPGVAALLRAKVKELGTPVVVPTVGSGPKAQQPAP